MILNDKRILEFIKKGEIVIDPFYVDALGPTCYVPSGTSGLIHITPSFISFRKSPFEIRLTSCPYST